MRRVYCATAVWKEQLNSENKVMNIILEGIQNAGGEIIQVTAVSVQAMGSTISQKTVILYEDNNHYESILEFLEDKGPHLNKWMKREGFDK